MIDTVINHLAATLNQSLRRAFSVAEDLVVASCLHEQDGNVAVQAANKVAVFLVNIERDTLPQTMPRSAASPGVRVGLTHSPVCLNLMVMFAAHFGGSHYGEALKLIAGTIAFFQSRPVLDHHNTPELDPRIDRLALDIENLSMGDLGNVWGLLGGRYVPSVLYKVRMVSIDAGQVFAHVPRVIQPELHLE